MAFFRRSRPEARPSPSRLAHGSVQLPSGKERRVAGLSFHTDNLRKITRSAPNQSSGWKVSATLVREPENPHDPNAIGIWVDGMKIGHVNRPDAVTLAPLIDNLESAGCRATCDCKIYGGDNGIFGADLWITVESRLTKWVANEIASLQSPAPFNCDP